MQYCGTYSNSTIKCISSPKLNLNLFFSHSQTAMETMGLIAIIVNCYLIGQCGQLQRLFPWLSPEMAIISIVILEVHHGLFLLVTLFLTSDRCVCYNPAECVRMRKSARISAHV